MLIKCPECNHENQLGAIFCRNCGAKLDIEKIHPEVKDQRMGLDFMGVIRKLVGTIILLLVVAVLVGLFLPYGLKEYPEPSEASSKAAKDKMAALTERIDSGVGDSKFVFSPEEATVAYNSSFLEKINGDTGSSYAIDRLIFDLTASNDVRIVMMSRLGGKLPARFEIVGTIEFKPGEGETPAPSIKLNVASAKMGHIPMIGDFLKGKILEKYFVAAEGQGVKKVADALSGLEVDANGNFVLSLPETKKPVSKKK